jgi:peptidylprolyl isomerase
MRLRALFVVVPLVVLAACSSGSSDNTSSTSASGSSSEAATPGPEVPPDTALAEPVAADQLPTASGAFGEKPTLTFPATDPVPTLQRVVLSEGTGPLTTAGQTLVTNYLGQVWGGTVFDNSYDKGSSSVFSIGTGAVVPGWDVGLVGVPVGSRVLLNLPPNDGYGMTGNASAGITGTDTLVFVVDIVGAYDATAAGQTDATPVPLPATGPQVTGELGTAPTLTIPAGTAEPTAASATVIATGTGPAVTDGQVLAQYDAVTWDGQPYASTWPNSAAAQQGAPTGPQAIPVATGGPFAGLAGIPVGSRVLVVISGQADPSTGQTQPAIAAVVDIVAQI